MIFMKSALLPEIEPYERGWLEVSGGHRIYWETCGNPEGQPVVWIHGGPGSRSSPVHRRFFDPRRYRIILYDQRGCGASEPPGELDHNHTAELVEDLESLRSFLGVTHWHVVGGSWGGGLALAYAWNHPEKIGQLLLRSPFLCTADEIARFLEHPKAQCASQWKAFMATLPEAERLHPLDCLHHIFCMDDDKTLQLKAATAWAAYETAMNAYPARAPEYDLGGQSEGLIRRYRIQSHYLKSGCFMHSPTQAPWELLSKLPVTLVHGLDDAICPAENSRLIHMFLPESRLLLLPGCGHELLTDPMVSTLRSIIDGWSIDNQ
jgi:proline iminopeptidase